LHISVRYPHIFVNQPIDMAANACDGVEPAFYHKGQNIVPLLAG
jgi:hypothetical protein